MPTHRIVLAALLLLATLVGCGSDVAAPRNDVDVDESKDGADGSVTMSFDFDGERENLELEFVPYATAFEIMNGARKGGELEFESTGPPMPFVTSIEGVENEGAGGRNWQYWINGEYATVGIGEYEPEAGDEIEWRFAKRSDKAEGDAE